VKVAVACRPNWPPLKISFPSSFPTTPPLPYAQHKPSPYESRIVNIYSISRVKQNGPSSYSVNLAYDVSPDVTATIPDAVSFNDHDVSPPYLSIVKSKSNIAFCPFSQGSGTVGGGVGISIGDVVGNVVGDAESSILGA